MNHVTFETAKRLEAAGFPKPKVEIGQVWYNYNGFAFFISLADYQDSTGVKYVTGISVVDGKTGASFHPDQTRLACTFAPTATDILKELPLERLEFGIDYKSGTGESWSVGLFSHSTNPAEASAMAWLQIHGKP